MTFPNWFFTPYFEAACALESAREVREVQTDDVGRPKRQSASVPTGVRALQCATRGRFGVPFGHDEVRFVRISRKRVMRHRAGFWPDPLARNDGELGQGFDSTSSHFALGHQQAGVCAKSKRRGRVVQRVDEAADQLALGRDWVRGDRVHEIADELTRRYWIRGNVQMEVMDEAADQLALRRDWLLGSERVHEIAHELTRRYWIRGNVQVEVMDEAADQLALRRDWVRGNRVHEIADEVTETEAGVWHDDFPLLTATKRNLLIEAVDWRSATAS